MSNDKKQIEEELVEQARHAIRKILYDLPDVSEITLSDMEQLIPIMCKQVMYLAIGEKDHESTATR